MTALTRLLLLQPLIVASNSALDLNFTSMYQIGALEVCLTCTWLIIRTQRELKNAPLVGGFWAAVASVWYLKYFCKSYIYFSQCDIVSICSDSPASPTGDRWETENAEHLNINKLFLLLAILPPHKYSGLILTKYLQQAELRQTRIWMMEDWVTAETGGYEVSWEIWDRVHIKVRFYWHIA